MCQCDCCGKPEQPVEIDMQPLVGQGGGVDSWTDPFTYENVRTPRRAWRHRLFGRAS